MAGAVAAQAIEASAGLRPDQAITEAAWLAGTSDEKGLRLRPEQRPGPAVPPVASDLLQAELASVGEPP